jgi:hypothetical protein
MVTIQTIRFKGIIFHEPENETKRMTESNAPYVCLYELIECSAKGRRRGTRRELIVLTSWIIRFKTRLP